eukprot:scaffold68896_cov20-Tisochrysis_lutea.AAC.2
MFSACPSALFPNAHPAFPFKHTQVERLVVSGAADPQVQSLPEAALMLATPEVCVCLGTMEVQSLKFYVCAGK